MADEYAALPTFSIRAGKGGPDPAYHSGGDADLPTSVGSQDRRHVPRAPLAANRKQRGTVELPGLLRRIYCIVERDVGTMRVMTIFSRSSRSGICGPILVFQKSVS